MKAYRLTAWQSPPEMQEVPVPEPGPGQVLIKVGGAGACHSDLHLMHDFEAGALPWGPPFTPGEGVEGLESATPSGSTAVGPPLGLPARHRHVLRCTLGRSHRRRPRRVCGDRGLPVTPSRSAILLPDGWTPVR